MDLVFYSLAGALAEQSVSNEMAGEDTGHGDNIWTWGFFIDVSNLDNQNSTDFLVECSESAGAHFYQKYLSFQQAF